MFCRWYAAVVGNGGATGRDYEAIPFLKEYQRSLALHGWESLSATLASRSLAKAQRYIPGVLVVSQRRAAHRFKNAGEGAGISFRLNRSSLQRCLGWSVSTGNRGISVCVQRRQAASWRFIGYALHPKFP